MYYLLEAYQPVQLGIEPKDNNVDKYIKDGTWFAEHKIDGIRMLLIIRPDKSFKVYTRNGKDISEKFKKIFPAYKKLIDKAIKVQPNGVVLDGEFYYKSIFNTQSILFTRKSDPVPNKDYSWFIFDVIPLKDWNRRKCDLTYDQRRKILEKIIPHDFDGFKTLKRYRIKSIQDLKDRFKEALSKGYEGLMLKREDSLYRFKRTSDWVKMKPFKSSEFKCIGVEEGTGKNKGKLGAIVIDYKGRKVKVGSGFSDQQRKFFWKNKNDIIGKCVEVMYFAKTNKESLRFPRFVKVRNDKTKC